MGGGGSEKWLCRTGPACTPLPPCSAAASAVWKLYWCQAQSVLMNPEIWEAKLVQRQKSIFQPVVTAPTSTLSCSFLPSLSLSLSGQRSQRVWCVSILPSLAPSTSRSGCGVPWDGTKPTKVLFVVGVEPGWLCTRGKCALWTLSWHVTFVLCTGKIIIKYNSMGQPSRF